MGRTDRSWILEITVFGFPVAELNLLYLENKKIIGCASVIEWWSALFIDNTFSLHDLASKKQKKIVIIETG